MLLSGPLLRQAQGHDAEVGSAMAAADDRAELKPRLAGSTSAVREVTVYMHSV